MTKEQYDRIVEPDAPFEEIEKKPKKSKTIAEYVEAVLGHELSKRQKEFITYMYAYYKNNPDGMTTYTVHGRRGTTNILAVSYASLLVDIFPFLALKFDKKKLNQEDVIKIIRIFGVAAMEILAVVFAAYEENELY